MDLLPIEELLKRAAGAVLADPRVVRRIIKHDRDVRGLVPHARCYPVDREALFKLVEPNDIGADASQLPPRVILLSRPTARELVGRSNTDVLVRLWRAVFHARIHETLDRRIAEGGLNDSEIRQRIDRIGQTEFDEVRAILHHDDLVLPPLGDREVYVEFAALYLELRHFAPNLLVTTFPGLSAYERVDETLARDLDIRPLLDAGRPQEVQPFTRSVTFGSTSAPSFSAPPSFGFVESLSAASVSAGGHARLLKGAAKARTRNNDVRAALLCARAATVRDEDKRRQAERAAREAVMSLGKRLQRALQGPDDGAKRAHADWSALLFLVADRAAAERGIGASPEARMLYGLQRAALAHERGQRIVDVPGWILSFGQRKVVRDLPAARELLVARQIHAAARRMRNVRIGEADRKLLAKLLAWASERADHNVRAALRPRIHRVLAHVGLHAKSTPEKLALDKLTEELLDEVVARGYLSFGLVRDALSRNQLKLDDLQGAAELLTGDALLQTDRQLTSELDGIYQRGDIYLRGLQVMSSVPFGTRTGRFLTLWFLLPLGGAYILLFGGSHIVSWLIGWFGLGEVHALTPVSFAITSALLLALIHSSFFRAFAWQVLEIIGLILATVLLRIPRALLTLSAVRLFLARPTVRMVLRRVVAPALVALLVWWLTPYRMRDRLLGVGVGLSCFVLASVALGSRLGVWAEDFVFDQLAPSWHVLSRQWIPGLVRLIIRFFSELMDLLQRGMYFIDEQLRYREGEPAIMLAIKGGVGLVWAMIAYLIRLYVTLLVEPFTNPVKHFPVVVVADKLMLSVAHPLVVGMATLLKPIGAVAAGAIAGVTVFLLPSIFGFLAWEFKENYRLYRATRPEHLDRVALGPDGETMRGLLVVGLHSGSLPKLYERLRRAAQREDELLAAGARGRRIGAMTEGLGRFRDGIRKMELCVRHFVERELCAPLARCPRWRPGPMRVNRVDLSSNRIRVQIELVTASSPQPCELTFEEQSGYIVAGFAQTGFLAAVTEDEVASLLFENALAGLYHRAEVDLVREQIENELGSTANYDISDEGLVVWPGRDYRTELVYAIGGRRRGALPPTVNGAQPADPPPVLDTKKLLFSAQAIDWSAWVTAWTAAEHDTAEVSRLVQGASILPPPDDAPVVTINEQSAAS